MLERLASGSLTTKEILNSNLEAFGSGSKEQFMGMVKAENEGRNKTDSGVFNDVFRRINLPDGDPKKINDENDLNQYMGNGLSFESLNQLRKEVQGANTTEGKIENEMKKGIVEMAQGALTKSNPMTGIRDPSGDTQMMRFQTWFQGEWASQRKKGRTVEELTNPDSQYYLGKGISKFVRSQDQMMQDMISSMNGSGTTDGGLSSTPAQVPGAPAGSSPPVIDNPRARKPGESIQAWRDRTKAGS